MQKIAAPMHLGVKIGVDYDSILKLLSFVTFVNVILSFFLAYYSNEKGKKNLFILDIVIDIIPCMLFAFQAMAPRTNTIR